ncbi:MAG: NAD(P)/FAD-dependent oxidoreductase [Proteobacteria bacterium]|nr:NAD(P)/FAD-dependent oxidoreductase [Pseudomonadota bacterium]
MRRGGNLPARSGVAPAAASAPSTSTRGFASVATHSILAQLNPKDAAQRWLGDFGAALAGGNYDAAAALFTGDGHWRDLVALSWDIRTTSGRDNIRLALSETCPDMKPTSFRIAEKRTQPRRIMRAGVDVIEAIFAFETKVGEAFGLVRLVPTGQGDKLAAWVLLTTLEDIKGHEQRIGARRPRGEEWSGGFGGENWMDVRKRTIAFEDREPAVVVIGGSQAGLGIAACLGVLGIDTLVIDKHERVGDAWRKRYHNLTLHNEVFVDDLPYMPFPQNYPVYIPRDKIANWLEFYADTMELNVWLGTEFTKGSYDEKTETWTLSVKRADGSERILKPRHVVFATGVSAIPVMPKIPGLDTFKGTVMHSAHFQDGRAWKGKNAIVFGTGNSGHDVAHDLCNSGANTSMVQRDTTLVVSLKEAQRVYELYLQGVPVEDCDMIATASPYPVLVQGYKLTTKLTLETDRKLHEGLKARGFRLDEGKPDSTGFQMKYLRRGGGYYFNVGASDLIVEGKIGLLHYHDMERIVPEGLKMKDGRTVPADLIVASTGYKNQQDVVRHFMGDAIADRIGQVWGFDEGGELHNMWRRTPQPGLWFVGGGLPHVRIYSKYLAQQIKASEVGLIAKSLPHEQRPKRMPQLKEAAE